MKRASADEEVLGPKALNRALLARQMLLKRERATAKATLGRLVGMQAQIPASPYVGLWTRLASFRPSRLSTLIEERDAVRIALMRSTIHLVTSDDCLTLRPLVQPVVERSFQTNHGKRLKGVMRADLVSEARSLLDQGPIGLDELGGRLQARFPGNSKLDLSQAVRAWVPLVQVPPRGLWRQSGAPMHASAESWLGKPFPKDPDPTRVVERYLAAFGPASVADVRAWSGIPGLGDIIEGMRERLGVVRDERDRELFDVKGGLRPRPDVPAPARFLPEYDNVLLAHADRSRIGSEEDRKRALSVRTSPGSLLVDGFFAAFWHLKKAGRAATLKVGMFRPFSRDERQEVREEATALLSFVANEAAATKIVFEKFSA